MSPLNRDALDRLAAKAPPAAPAAPTGDTRYDPRRCLEDITADLNDAGIELGKQKTGKSGDPLWELSGCPYSTDHTGGAFMVQYPSGYCLPYCHHARCRGKRLKDAPGVFTRTLAITPLDTGPTLKTGGTPVAPEPERERTPLEELDPGHVILDNIRAFLGCFVAYPSEHAQTAHTLWIAHTHLMRKWDSTPRIAFLSPEPGSGKTRALEVSEALVPRPVVAMNMSAAYLFRKVSDEAGQPTVLFDEIDTIFGPKAGPHEEVRGLLNAGHRRGAKAGRVEMQGKKAVPVEYAAYCAVALAGLGDLPDTILTRSVIVRMRKRAPHERVSPWRARLEEPEAHALRDTLADWCAGVADAITWPDAMPPGVEDRDADVWEPLLAVAIAAGGEWPGMAWDAATAMVAETKAQPVTLGVRLLEDLRTLFGDRDHMTTDAILKGLHGMDEAPWSELVAGKPLNARGLATRLGKYGVKSMTVREGKDTAKGYRREDLADAWSRYLPLPSPQTASHASHTSQPGDSGTKSPGNVTDVTHTKTSHARIDPSQTGTKPGNVTSVTDVTDFSGKGEKPTPLRVCVHCGQPVMPGSLYCERHAQPSTPTGTDGDYSEVI